MGGSAKIKLLEDRISNLPEELIQCIVKHLPVDDAVRTSILSKDWRNIWIMHPRLVLDMKFYTRLIFNKDKETHTYEFKRTMERIFLVHTGPILNFYLYVPPQLDQFPIYWLIEHLSKKGVRTIQLVTSNRYSYVIPSSLFDCTDLTQLILTKWILMPYRNFTNLVHIQLNQVLISDPISFGSKLAVLELENCIGIQHLGSQFITTNNLTRLFISTSTQIDWRWFECTTKLKALGLVLVPADPNMKDVANLVNLLTNIPSCVALYLNGPTLELFGPAPSNLTRLTTNVPNMKELKLCRLGLYDMCQISNTLFLITSFPNLRQLCINLELEEKCVSHEELRVQRYLKSLDRKSMCLSQLRNVQINGVVGSRSLLHFIKLVLASSPLLRKLSLCCSTKIKCLEEKVRIKQELQQFPSLSLQVQIVCC